jgi:hypothetical protein
MSVLQKEFAYLIFQDGVTNIVDEPRYCTRFLSGLCESSQSIFLCYFSEPLRDLLQLPDRQAELGGGFISKREVGLTLSKRSAFEFRLYPGYRHRFRISPAAAGFGE